MINKEQYIIKTNRYKNGKVIYQKYYRAYCDLCGIDREIYQTNSTNKKRPLCLSCCAKKRIKKSGNPMLGKHHKDLTIFRKEYLNVDYDDYILITNYEGKQKRKYKMYCPICKKDRGYQFNCEAKRICIKCHADKYRKKSDIQRKIYNSMKANINIRLNNRNILKNYGIFRYLPYTLEELMNHLEKQFESWMNWSNHGLYNPDSQLDKNKRTWQIDHIIPDSAFKYRSVKEKNFQQSWAVNNLRPLESRTNIIKSNNI